MANDMTINQISTVLNGIVKQATGQNSLAVTDTSSFVTVAQAALKVGYDQLTTAISQVLSRTIFSVRPYTRKFGGLEVSNQRYGNHVRKLSAVDKDWVDDDRTKLVDGQSVDQYKVRKPEVQQLNFYGQETYERYMTIYRDQLDTAFSSPDELEYNAETGGKLTASTVLAPSNIEGFVKWLTAKIQTVADLMTERSTLFHQTIAGKNISRHTPYENQRLYMYAEYLNKVDAYTLSSAFHEEYLKTAYNEKVNYWQSIRTPFNIDVTPGYSKADGTSITTGEEVNKPILAVLFDSEAAGYTVVNEWSQPTPMNAAGGYTNFYWHFTDRYYNDFTENHAVFVLD